MKGTAFDLTGRVAVITGGAGLLGLEHGRAIASTGGVPVLLDTKCAEGAVKDLVAEFGVAASAVQADVTRDEEVAAAVRSVLGRYGRVDILINNAANNPKAESNSDIDFSRIEDFSMRQWEGDIAVGLTGAFLCARAFGGVMARRGHGVILNIASDLSVIAPDQRIYRREGLTENQQPVKPVTYSVVKAGLIGLTRYLATYWAAQGVRVNALSPGGVENNQSEEFVRKLTQLIPMGRMARRDEYRASVLYLCSDASTYMTGQNLIVDGGRSCW